MFSRFKRDKVDVNRVLEKTKQEPELELEKGDLTAIIIAACIVILPVLLSFVGVVLLVYWFFIGRF